MFVYQNNPLNEFAQPVVSVGLDSAFFNSELNSLLSCNKTWFCFRTLYYKSKRKIPSKSKPHISTGFHHWFLHATCYLSKFSLVCNANAETTVRTSSKPQQSKPNMCLQCVLAGITKSVCIVLGISAPLEFPACEAFSASSRGSKTSRNYGCKWNNTNVTWGESYTIPPPAARITVQRDCLLCRIVNKSVSLALKSYCLMNTD